jgi:lysophospholipase L1-like esterase
MGRSDRPRNSAFVRWFTATAAGLAILMGLGIGTSTAAQAATASPPAPPGPPMAGTVNGTWGASTDRTGATVSNQTVRDIVRTSIGGSGLEIKLSNVFGSQPVTFGDVTVGVQQSGAALVPGSVQQVTFSGSQSVTIPPGAEALSDPLRGNVAPQSNLAVSAFVEGSAGTVTGHNLAEQTSYVSTAGDHAAEDAATAFPTTIQSWYFLDGIFVTAPRSVGTVVAFGDSITDGFGSTAGADDRWPDFLARRLLQQPPPRQMGVLNEGISGNKLLTDGSGVSALARFDRDVLAQPNVKTVILLEGINDLSGGATPDQVIAADEQLAARAHAAGKCIVGATLTPFGTSSATEQAAVVTVNNFIRSSPDFDGVVDFNKAVADPANPNQMLPAFNSGDGLHPNDAGYQAMANAISLPMLNCNR